MHLRRFLIFCCLVMLVGVAPAATGAPASPLAASTPSLGLEPLPPGVQVQTLIEGMNQPVAMAFDPVGRLFYTEKTGAVRLFANGTLQPNPVINYNVDNCSERGLLGIAIDPNFSQNHYIYIYYTQGSSCGATENRVARFVENNGVGSNSVDIFSSPQTAGNHDGGNIHFGPDGKLYVSIGENATPANSQDVTARNGKLHRINPDGSTPTNNPNFNRPGALPSLYAIGLRNSFDFTFDPVVRGRIFASENGPGCDDEMNRIEAGFNYGWRPNYPCDDDNPDPAYNNIPPLWHVDTQSCCTAPTGITVYTGDQIPQWHNHLFMLNYQSSLYHFYLNADRTTLTAANRVENIGAGLDIETGPDGALYFIEGGGYNPGSLKRFVGTGGGATPSATPTNAPSPATTATVTPAPAPQLPGSGSRTFKETGKTVTGIFLNYWNSHGGLAQQGYPISNLLQEVSDLNGKPYTVQYFERAVFEYHPELQPPFNVLLSQLGTFQYRKKYPNGAPVQKPNTSTGSVLVPETGKRLGGRFLQYWQQHGGLLQQGYPISDEFTEVSDLNGKPYLVQYFERAVFEYHPENAAPYDVLLSQLGTFRYREKYGR
ncbi:MAG: PQQ-dependent sugar dehydrogenase [Chloroflexia bacterium]